TAGSYAAERYPISVRRANVNGDSDRCLAFACAGSAGPRRARRRLARVGTLRVAAGGRSGNAPHANPPGGARQHYGPFLARHPRLRMAYLWRSSIRRAWVLLDVRSRVSLRRVTRLLAARRLQYAISCVAQRSLPH